MMIESLESRRLFAAAPPMAAAVLPLTKANSKATAPSITVPVKATDAVISRLNQTHPRARQAVTLLSWILWAAERTSMRRASNCRPTLTSATGGRSTVTARLSSADGQSYGRVWYFRDVTKRRQTARQILQAGERERQRIGQDLHDDLCQQLAGITCLGRVLHQRVPARLPEEATAAARIVDLVEQAVHRARDISRRSWGS
jgi:signal transduction histidine kinase